MSLDGFISAGPRLEKTWRLALITSAAVDITLYALVLVQSVRYLSGTCNGLHADGSSAGEGTPLPPVSSTNSSSRDGKRTRDHCFRRPWDWLVVILVVIATFKVGCSLAVIILLRKPAEGPEWVNLMTKLPFYIAPVLTATIGILTESFYLHRLFSLLRVQSSFLGTRWFRASAIISIECLFLAALALAIYCTYVAVDGWNYFAYYLIAHLSAACLGDSLVTLLTLACILGTKNSYHSAERRSRLSRFTRITALSAAIPAITALVNVICVAIPSVMILLWHNVPNYALGQLFILSFLWTLDSRQRVAHRSFERPSRRLTSPLGGEVWKPTKDDGRESGILNHTSMFAHTIPVTDINLELDRRSSISTPFETIKTSRSAPLSGPGRGYPARAIVNR